MTIKSQLMSDMKQAMKAKDKATLEAVKMLRAEIQRKEVDEQIELDDAGVLTIVQKMVKQAQGAIEQFKEAGRDDLVEKDQAYVDVLKQYLPEQLSAEAVSKCIDEAIAETGAESMKDMGKVMAALKSKLEGRADMGSVGPLVKSKLA